MMDTQTADTAWNIAYSSGFIVAMIHVIIVYNTVELGCLEYQYLEYLVDM
jgi:hypothetical protein